MRNGHWFEIPGSAHVEQLHKGDIIFNAAQTAELKKYGRVLSGGGRGRVALADGTAYNMMPAHYNSTATGSSTSLVRRPTTSSSSTKSNTTATNRNTASVNSNTASVNQNTAAAEEFTETIDWVEKALTYFSNKTKDIADTITDYVTSAYKTSQLQKQIKSIDDEIAANTKGYTTYINKAASVGLSYSWRLKVAQGNYSIQDITDENLANKIKEFEEYYNKAQDCRRAVVDLRTEQLELYEDWANMPAEHAEKQIEKLERSLKSLEAAYTTVSGGGSTTSKYLSQIKSDYNNKLKSAQTTLTKANSAKTTAAKNVSSATAAKQTADKAVQTATNNVKSTTNLLIKAAVARNSGVTDAQKQYMSNAIAQGKIINTKYLKGATLVAAQKYNASIIAKNKAVSTQAAANKKLTSAKSAYSTASEAVKTAQTQYNTIKNSLTEGQKKALQYANNVTYKGQNALLDAELSIAKQTSAERQTALAKANSNLSSASLEKDKAAATKAKTLSTAQTAIKNRDNYKNLLLNNSAFVKSLNTTQLAALKAGKAINTSGITNKYVLKYVTYYNKLVATATTAANNYATASQAATTATQKYNIALEAQQEASAEAAEAQAEYAEMLVSNELEKFENIQKYYEAVSKYEETWANKYATDRKHKEAYGQDTTANDYQKEIKEMQQQKTAMQNELDALNDQLNQSVKNGIIKKNSEEWYEMQNTIVSLGDEIDEVDMSILELQDTMRNEVFYRTLNEVLEKLDEVRGSIETIQDLIGDEMMFDDAGLYTDFGITALALNIKEYESYLQSMDTLLAKRQAYIDNYNNGYNATNYSQKEFEEDMKNIQSEIQSMLGNANSARKAIIDMVLNQSKAELDATLKVIEAREELLKKQKDYYDYDKSLKSKTNDLQLLDQQISALDGVADAESRAQKARLEAERKQLQDELDETVQDHRYEIQVAGLDDLKTTLQENYDNYVKELNSNLEQIVSTVGSTTDSINACLGTVNGTINKLLESFGIAGLTNEVVGVPQYASGTTSSPTSGWARVNERGREVIINKYGTFVPLDLGDGVLRADLTARMVDMAMNYPDMEPQIYIPDVASSTANTTISPVVQCPITIWGNANEEELAATLKKNLPYITQSVQNEIRKDLRKSGR